jgi:general stress protein 26
MPSDEESMIEWPQARQKLEDASAYWVVSVNEDGSPHSTPLWGVWLKNRFYVEGDPRVRWARNLRERPMAIVHLDSSDDVVSVHGSFVDIPHVEDDVYAGITAEWDRKYRGYRPADPDDHGFYVMTPTKAFAWTEYPRTATRFRWPDRG